MPRPNRKKPRNVVKSRTAPSLLGGRAAGRLDHELPTNRFIELGDIALGNARHFINQSLTPGRENMEEPDIAEVRERLLLPDAQVIPDVAKPIHPPKPPKIKLPRPVVRRPPSMPKTAPLSRPKLPAPPKAQRPQAPKLPPPPKAALPKVVRPKPLATGALKSIKKVALKKRS